jgi:hypothetical protein
MFVETLIQRLACGDTFIFDPEIVSPGWEKNFVESLATQLSMGNTLTEKQAVLSIRLLKKYQVPLEVYFKTKIDLDNPVFAHPFRKLHIEKTIAVRNGTIQVKFPYDEELIKDIQKFVSETAVQPENIYTSSTAKSYIGAWNHDDKVWAFSLREETVLWLGSNLLSKNFTADATFLEWYNTINGIIDNANEYAITAVKADSGFLFKNASNKIPLLDTGNVIEFLYHAKNYGVSIWDESIDADLRKTECSPVTTALLNATGIVYIDSRAYGLENFKDLLLFGGPTLIVIPGGSEIKHTEAWHRYASSIGIENKDIAVMFRTPNQDNGGFNAYVKENELNNNVHETTKIVFVSTKIPKPLVKSDIVFNTVVNLGYYNNMHFSMNILLTSPANIVYYNDKKPQGATICLPQN